MPGAFTRKIIPIRSGILPKKSFIKKKNATADRKVINAVDIGYTYSIRKSPKNVKQILIKTLFFIAISVL